MSIQSWAYAAAIAIATAAGAVVSKVLDVIHERRRSAGSVRTSDAGEIWDANNKFVEHMQGELRRMDTRIDTLQTDNEALREANARLVYANEALIQKVDELRAANTSLVHENKKLGTRVTELLTLLGEHPGPLSAASG